MNDVLNNRKKFYKSSYPINRFQNILSATKTQPNEMLLIYGKSKLPYLIKKAIASRIDDILIITGNQLENSIWKINENQSQFRRRNPSNQYLLKIEYTLRSHF